jgi:hypothetical protein
LSIGLTDVPHGGGGRRILISIIRKAAWPGVVVLIAHAILGKLFGHEPIVDPVMHFLGGGACAFFVVALVRLRPRWFGELPPLTSYLLAFGLTSAVAVLWELGEFLSDLYLGTRTHTSIASTLRDLLNGLLGSLVFIAAHWFLARRPPEGDPAAVDHIHSHSAATSTAGDPPPNRLA